MWRWDQGHLEYFQFDAIRKIANYVTRHDFISASRAELLAETGLTFSAPATHSPWRNYSRALKLSLLVSKIGNTVQATPVAHILAQPGAVTCDEYMHFLARCFTSPSPAFAQWDNRATPRYPLLFSLKYLLAKAIITPNPFASIDEVLGAYEKTGFAGDEDSTAFITAVRNSEAYEPAGQKAGRQCRESLRVMAQISYLYIQQNMMFVSLDPADAQEIFADLAPVIGPRDADPEAEIRRLASLFADGSTSIAFEYPHTVVNEIEESGFREGTKVKKTHITIERNPSLRREFFASRPTAVCDVCETDTARSFPWAERVMDLHHLLPLSSGTRVQATGTTLDDLVPVCPLCHRAIHRFYDRWLANNGRKDFQDGREALSVYQSMKASFPGLIHA